MESPRRTVLIVEDELPILQMLADYLSDHGFEVLQAASSTKAFEILATQPALDLLLTDFRLPDGVSGVLIAEPALKLRPDLKVVFISAYPDEILDTGSPITRAAPVLGKPFSLENLKRQIKTLLG